jgi:hypothetical protein
MATKLVFENGCGLTPARVRKLQEAYEVNGILNLPTGYFIRQIQGLPPENRKPMTLIIIGKA